MRRAGVLVGDGTGGALFPISISVGSGCQAHCPYCAIPKLPQKVASGDEIVEAIERLMRELGPHHEAFRVRLTGGEVGLVPGVDRLFAWLNRTEIVRRVRVFTNGELFRHDDVDLSRKCRVYDHPVHDIVRGRWIRYARDPAPDSLEALGALIAERRLRCLRYRCVIVDRATFDESLRGDLTALGVKLVPLSGPSAALRPAGPPARERFCFASRYLYVYDVAHDLYFHCCEVKDPALGKRSRSLTQFLSEAPGAPYPQCRTCRTCADIWDHPNSGPIERQRGVEHGAEGADAKGE